MIVFDLKCEYGHGFEAWFKSADDMQTQRKKSLVSCPTCNSTVVQTALSVPNVGRKGNQSVAAGPGPSSECGNVAATTPPAETPEAVKKAIETLQEHISKNCEYVGEKFPEEARKMHYGERDKAEIWGEASPEETAELMDEGIDVVPVPFAKKPIKTDA